MRFFGVLGFVIPNLCLRPVGQYDQMKIGPPLKNDENSQGEETQPCLEGVVISGPFMKFFPCNLESRPRPANTWKCRGY